MKRSYLQVTHDQGRPLAAYYSLPRRGGDRNTRTKRAEGELLVDFSSDDRAIGIEITSPSRFDLTTLNELLARLGQEAAGAEEIAPLIAS